MTKLKLIGGNWANIHRLTKITIKEDYNYFGLEGTKQTLKKGVYYICGFWCDAMGLSDTLQGARDINNKYLIPSKALIYFYI